MFSDASQMASGVVLVKDGLSSKCEIIGSTLKVILMPLSPGLYVTLISFSPSIRNARIDVWTNVTFPEACENGGCRTSLVKKKEFKNIEEMFRAKTICFALEICPIE